jgi:hypothetical protein
MVAQFETPEALRDALTRFIAENSVQAYVLYRELDFFEYGLTRVDAQELGCARIR